MSDRPEYDKPCPNCEGTGNVNPSGDISTSAIVDCPVCDGTGSDLQHALDVITKGTRDLAVKGATTAHELARQGDPYLVPRWSSPQERLDEIEPHALTSAFHEMARFPAPPPPDSTERQREAIGRAIAEYMMSAQRGEHADDVANRVVAAVGPVEAFEIANVLGKWAGAIAARAERAERLGLRR